MKALIAPLALAALGALALVMPAQAQTAYPNRNIVIVVPTATGGGNDSMARILSQPLASALGQAVVIDNRAGGNGAIASEYVARAAPDGYTLMFGYIATHAMNPALQKLRYDPVNDFEPVGLVGTSATLMVANPAVSARDVQELIAQAKASPDKFSYASAGYGTAPHFAAELFNLRTGAHIVGVPYKGSAPAITDTISGQTQIMFPSFFTALPQVRGGKLRALAIAGPRRHPLLPEVPTLAEAGVEGVDVEQWYGFFAPARTPRSVVDKLNRTLNQVLADKEVARRIEVHGTTVETSTPEQFGALVKAELAKWRNVVQRAGLTAE